MSTTYTPVSKIFTDRQDNIVMDIMAKAAGIDPAKLASGDAGAKSDFYAWQELAPLPVQVSVLVMAMGELGLKIVENTNGE